MQYIRNTFFFFFFLGIESLKYQVAAYNVNLFKYINLDHIHIHRTLCVLYIFFHFFLPFFLYFHACWLVHCQLLECFVVIPFMRHNCAHSLKPVLSHFIYLSAFCVLVPSLRHQVLFFLQRDKRHACKTPSIQEVQLRASDHYHPLQSAMFMEAPSNLIAFCYPMQMEIIHSSK